MYADCSANILAVLCGFCKVNGFETSVFSGQQEVEEHLVIFDCTNNVPATSSFPTRLKQITINGLLTFIGFVSIIREKVLDLKGAFQRTFNRPLSRLLLLRFHAFAWNCSSNNLLSGLLNVLCLLLNCCGVGEGVGGCSEVDQFLMRLLSRKYGESLFVHTRLSTHTRLVSSLCWSWTSRIGKHVHFFSGKTYRTRIFARGTGRAGGGKSRFGLNVLYLLRNFLHFPWGYVITEFHWIIVWSFHAPDLRPAVTVTLCFVPPVGYRTYNVFITAQVQTWLRRSCVKQFLPLFLWPHQLQKNEWQKE